jgi:hypothetical protein
VIIVTTYRTKPNMTKQDMKALVDVHATQGNPPGMIAHYVSVDRSHGVVVAEVDELGPSYRHALEFEEWLQFQVVPMLTVDDALPHVLDSPTASPTSAEAAVFTTHDATPPTPATPWTSSSSSWTRWYGPVQPSSSVPTNRMWPPTHSMAAVPIVDRPASTFGMPSPGHDRAAGSGGWPLGQPETRRRPSSR